jgi:hypothetical protein
MPESNMLPPDAPALPPDAPALPPDAPALPSDAPVVAEPPDPPDPDSLESPQLMAHTAMLNANQPKPWLMIFA